MKRSVLLTMVLVALALSVSWVPSRSNASPAKRQSDKTVFNTPVKLLNVVLKGEYLIVHDDEAMARGENCTFVYDLNGGGRNLVLSFHCVPVQRGKASSFIVRTVQTSPDAIPEVREFQFAGSTESHQVPMQ